MRPSTTPSSSALSRSTTSIGRVFYATRDEFVALASPDGVAVPKLDLYLPEGVKGFATVVWFYGGGLEGGDKGHKVNVAIATTLARHGVGCAVANYRLAPKAANR